MRTVPMLLTLFACASGAGCSHAMRITNLGEYDPPPAPRSAERYRAGVTSATLVDPGTRRYVEAVVDAMRRSGDYEPIVFPYAPSSGEDVDLVIDIAVTSRYSGRGTNFLVSWPGFLIFAPALFGYGYRAEIDTQVSVTRLAGGGVTAIAVPARYDFRQAELDRTWTEIGWLEVGIIPLVGGFVFTSYDPDLTPEFVAKVSPSYGRYVAAKIREAL